MRSGRSLLVLFTEEISLNTASTNPRIKQLLKEFQDVFSSDIRKGLPPVRGIEHQIHLIPKAPLTNKPNYRTNPTEAKEI